jgi:hypothetical protein
MWKVKNRKSERIARALTNTLFCVGGCGGERLLFATKRSAKSFVKLQLFFVFIFSFLFFGCDETGGDFTLRIDAQPTRAHAPMQFSFSLDRDDALSLDGCLADWDFGDGVKLSGLLACEHIYQSPGKYTVLVDLRCDKKRAKAKTTVELFAPVELGIDSLQVRPRDINTGAKLSVALQLTNYGAALQTATSLSVYLSESPSLELFKVSDANRIYDIPIESMPAAGSEGASKSFSLEIALSNSLRTGQYYVVAAIDPVAAVGDSDRSNNLVIDDGAILIRNQATDGADVKAISLDLSPSRTRNLTSFMANFELTNEGSATAMRFDYELWLGQKNEATQRETGRMLLKGYIDGIGSGASLRLQDVLVPVNPAITEAGLYYAWLVLDADDALSERDEDNNIVRSTGPIQVSDESILDADIIVNSLDFEPKSAVSLGSLSMSIEIYNQGSQPTGSFVCSLYMSKNQNLVPDKDLILGSINIYDLLSNQSQEHSTLVEIPADVESGDYWLFAYCDSSGVVAEANEDNNIQRSSTTLSIVSQADVDLSIAALTLSGSSEIESGANIELSARICNMGTTGAGPNVLEATVINLCNGAQREVFTEQISGVEANSCKDISLSIALHCDFWCERYDMSFSIDATNVIHETNENNNTRVLASGATVVGDSCACVEDAFEPNQNLATAAVLPAGDHSLSLCQNDEDWFELKLRAGESVELELEHLQQRGALSMALWKEGRKLAQDLMSDSLYLSLYDVAAPTSYFVQVRSQDGKGNAYALKLRQYPKSAENDLAISGLKIEDDALDIEKSRKVDFSIHNLGQSISEDFRVSFYLSQTPDIAEGAEALASRVYHGQSVAVVHDSIQLRLPLETQAGIWRLIAKVDVDDVIDESNETNNIGRSLPWSIERVCWDVLDPNDSFEAARTIALSGDDELSFSAESLRVCQNNPDFYQFSIPSNYSLHITATNLGSGDFDLFLYDAYHNEIASARTAKSVETLLLPLTLGSEPLVLEVRQLQNPFNPNESRYSLQITAKAVPDWQTCDASFEPNNFSSSAYSLRSSAIAGGAAALCPASDVDYYYINLSAGQRLQLAIQTTAATLRAALYSPGGSFAALLTDLLNQSFDYTAPMDGMYHVKIYSNSSEVRNQPYTLKLQGLEGLDLAVGDLAVLPQNPIAGDVVQVRFSLKNLGNSPIVQSSYRVDLLQNSTQHTVVQDNITQSIAVGEKLQIAKKFNIPSGITGVAQVVLEAQIQGEQDIYSPNNTQSISITIREACVPDAYEDNNSKSSATSITPSRINARICENDEDWYSFVAQENRKYTITLNFTHSTGDLDLYLYDEAALITQSRGNSDSEQIVFDAQASQQYYILVTAFDPNTRNDYQLRLE